ncbi:MAG: hypothetical protein II719_05175, partial [Clostridia bacterium]|nr:hypothetical protein [Clostridia bacterium]
YFWDLLEGLPGIVPIRVDESTGSTMGGWYTAQGAYRPQELHGLPVARFCEAVRAQGYENCWPGSNYCLHTHPLFKTFDYFHLGKPTRVSFTDRDVRLDDEKLKPSESKFCYNVPWFKKYDEEWIQAYANIFRTVVENHEQLLDGAQEEGQGGRWYGANNEG